MTYINLRLVRAAPRSQTNARGGVRVRSGVSGEGARRGRALETVIWLVVSVPVLSEQMTDVQPSVSTEGSERTIAFLRAIRRVPSARHVVITAGRPSGIAATASATAILK